MSCGGSFIKVKEPEGYQDKKNKKTKSLFLLNCFNTFDVKLIFCIHTNFTQLFIIVCKYLKQAAKVWAVLIYKNLNETQAEFLYFQKVSVSINFLIYIKRAWFNEWTKYR